MREMGLLLMAAGAFLLLLGAVLYFGPGLNFLGLGRLPGDIHHVNRGGFQLYFPITTSILISVVLTLLLLLFSRLR